VTFLAETGLDASTRLGSPRTIAGRLVSGIPLADFLQFTSRKDVEVNFLGGGYRFIRVDPDGGFELAILPLP
jgi:hypothetical protein